MTLDTILKWSPVILGWATAIVGWTVAFIQWRKRCKSEAEMKLIRRRAEAPYIEASNASFSQLYLERGEGYIRMCSAGDGNLLCFLKNEVDKQTEAGTPVLFVVENAGKSARRVSVSLDNQPAALNSEADAGHSQGLQFIQYPYQPEKHGQTQKLVIRFETENGVQDCHTYETKHGVRTITRLDPP